MTQRSTISMLAAETHFPRLPRPSLDLEGLAPADRQLAVAIHRTALQRWITLRFLLDRYLNKPLATLEPAMRGALLGGAAQLLFMPRLPAYAVVVPGSLPGRPRLDGSPGPSLYCAVIVKRVDAGTRAKVGINALLRDV